MSRQKKGSYITPLSGFSRFGKKNIYIIHIDIHIFIYIYTHFDIYIYLFISTQMFGINRIHDWKL